MKSCYFLPNNTGTEKFDSINDELKSVLLSITQVISFPNSKVSDFYPESYKNEIPEILFVPTIFDYSNGISYQGVEFALRWYLYIISKKNNGNFKIVLLGTEKKSAFFQNCTYSNFLKCPNVEYLQNSYEDISEYLKNIQIKKIDIEDALRKIDLIGIKPSTSYKSHHSIANEWSILRWSKALKIDTESAEELKKIETNVETSLYYKYLETKYPITGTENVINRLLLNLGKILFIDDELDKGWDIIFRSICKAKKYESFGIDFKGWSKEKIVSESFDMAKNADVVILDLRLHDEDFDEKDPKKITGYEILRKIKEHNKGIQVVIFSATNKIWNLQAMLEAGADGFIMKESPEDSLDNKFTLKSIENVYKILDESLDYSFLKKYINKFNFLKQELEPRKKYSVHPNPLPKEFVDEYLKWLEFGILNISKYKSNLGNILSFSIFFSVLENISNRIIDIDNPQWINHDEYKFKFRVNNSFLTEFTSTGSIYSNTNVELVSKRNLNWNQKVLNTLVALNSNLTDMNNLIKKRNDIIHSNSTTGNVANVTKEELNKLFEIITENIEYIN